MKKIFILLLLSLASFLWFVGMVPLFTGFAGIFKIPDLWRFLVTFFGALCSFFGLGTGITITCELISELQNYVDNLRKNSKY